MDWTNLLLKLTKSPRNIASLFGAKDLLTSQEQEEKDQAMGMYGDMLNKAIRKPAGVFNEALNDAAGATWDAMGVDTSRADPYMSMLRPEDQTLYNENPTREISKAIGSAASYAVPFGGFKSMAMASSPLLNQTLRYAVPGAIEGSTQGYGQSDPGNEWRDTLIGGGIGTAGELAGGLITNPEYRKMLGSYLEEGLSTTPYSNMYSGGIGNARPKVDGRDIQYINQRMAGNDEKSMVDFIDEARLKNGNVDAEIDGRRTAGAMGLNMEVPNNKLADKFQTILETTPKATDSDIIKDFSNKWGELSLKDATPFKVKIGQGGDKLLNAESEWIMQAFPNMDKAKQSLARQRIDEIINTITDPGQKSQIEFLKKHLGK